MSTRTKLTVAALATGLALSACGTVGETSSPPPGKAARPPSPAQQAQNDKLQDLKDLLVVKRGPAKPSSANPVPKTDTSMLQELKDLTNVKRNHSK